MTLYVRKNNLEYSRIGITVSKKIGKAVVRNKIRRRMKEIYREFEQDIAKGYDLVFVVKKNVLISFIELKSAFRHILKFLNSWGELVKHIMILFIRFYQRYISTYLLLQDIVGFILHVQSIPSKPIKNMASLRGPICR